jgi:hypothetical protein
MKDWVVKRAISPAALMTRSRQRGSMAALIVTTIIACQSVSTAGVMTFSVFADNFGTDNGGAVVPLPPLSHPNGVLTGSITVNDLNSNGSVTGSEILAWTFTTAGFADTRFNFTISSSDLVTSRAGAFSLVGPVLSVPSFIYFDSTNLSGLRQEVTFFANKVVPLWDQAGGTRNVGVESNPYTISPASLNSVPEPVSLAVWSLLSVGLFFGRRRYNTNHKL